MSEITELLTSIAAGNRAASEQLLSLVYDELRQLASRRLKSERPNQTLDATALVHEAYLRLFGANSRPAFRDRGHFFAAAATAMRRMVMDRARRKSTEKRGGAVRRQSVDEVPAPERNDELLALDAALQKFELIDPQKATLVELRYFGGLTSAQAAAVLGISATTADRHWAYARAWLRIEIADFLSD